MEWILATDIDNTLTGDRAALDALRAALDGLRANGRLRLILSTGRRLDHVLAGQPGRKQAFVAHAETWLTMSFKTEARTVAEAEAEFTDEAEHLGSRRDDAVNLIETTETLEIAA